MKKALILGIIAIATLGFSSCNGDKGKDSSQIAKEALEALKNAPKETPAADAADEADLTMEEGAALTIDRATGWPNDYYKERTISIIDKESGEVMKIVWVLGAADRRNLSKAD